MPTNINRYIVDTVDCGIASPDGIAFVYVKMRGIALVGLIAIEDRHEWRRTKIHVRSGTIDGSPSVCPSDFQDILFFRARYLQANVSRISEGQAQRIKETFAKSVDRVRDTEGYRAALSDLSLIDPSLTENDFWEAVKKEVD